MRAIKDDFGDRHTDASVGVSGSLATEHDAVPEFGPQAPQSPSLARARLPPFLACEFARPSLTSERSWKSSLKRWHSPRLARLGTLEHPLDHTVLVAEQDGRMVGALTYVVRDAHCEVLTLHARDRGKGVGSALIAEVNQIARRAGCAQVHA